MLRILVFFFICATFAPGPGGESAAAHDGRIAEATFSDVNTIGYNRGRYHTSGERLPTKPTLLQGHVCALLSAGSYLSKPNSWDQREVVNSRLLS